MIDGRNVDYIGIVDETYRIRNSIEDTKEHLKTAVSQDLFAWYNSKSQELINVLEEIECQLLDKNDNRY
jgi:hypothetical protein